MDNEIDDELDSELEVFGFLRTAKEFALDDLEFEAETEDDEDPEVAYHVGRASEPSDPCPYSEQEAIDEWTRGRADANRHDIYSMRHGEPPDHYRDPD